MNPRRHMASNAVDMLHKNSKTLEPQEFLMLYTKNCLTIKVDYFAANVGIRKPYNFTNK